ncbi:putative CRISPR-associated protein [Pyrodictium delaneyi]|uniref:Putative CRISPR-associated protein n=1 Tax=Pyrodictium delaneyi TaxID=1273541 RepID=A0A0P0N4U1_9CREN|nr:putative CRISPR-associated protein [Pyrodictium delaneyi]ALL01389.1 putative CRISPR-associated protein [Pyrodictium delaneyi]OWJ54512.1 putative CRISPR-associated protein [Pyrodictium delaneyi]
MPEPLYSSCEAHLATVGTSLLANTLRLVRQALASGSTQARLATPLGSVTVDFSQLGGPGALREVEECLASCADPARIDEEKCRRCMSGDTPARRAVELVLYAEPYTASAELNAARWRLGSPPRCPGGVFFVLYASDTIAGQLAAEILRGYLEDIGCRARVEVVKGLGQELWEGIAELARRIICHTDCLAARGCRVYVNPTGGFKPESAAAVLAAGLAGATAAYYVHEAMREPVFIPFPPLVVDARQASRLLHGAAALETRSSVCQGEVDDQLLALAVQAGAARPMPRQPGCYMVDEERARELTRLLRVVLGAGGCEPGCPVPGQ